MAVPIDVKFNPHGINSYKDYLNSPVEVALLSADSYVDLYVKDHIALKQILASCNKHYRNGTPPPQCITLDNNRRVKFEV